MAQVALVTGAGSGIGRASAVALAEAGFALVLAGRRAEALAETAALVEPHGPALVHPADVSDEAAVEGLFAAAVKRFGRLDLLFNNAGANAPAAIEDMTLAQWQHVVDVNLTGAFLCLRAAFRQFKAQTPRGGRIINNGSISAHVPRPRSAAYTATKHAMTGLTRQAALDGRALDIACGQIDIGNAESDMTRPLIDGVKLPDGTIFREPVMAVENVARAVVYMASLPLDANVPFMTVMPTKMPYMGRG